MKTIAIVDLETTSTDVATTEVVEIAVCLFSVEHATATSAFATTVHATDNPAASINGLPAEVLADAVPVERALKTVSAIVAKADVFLAHNGEGFDRPILERLGCSWAAPGRWIDSMEIEWPRTSTSRSLVSVALAHGLGVGSAHRALDDVMLTARLLSRAVELGLDLPAQVIRGLRPRARFVVSAKGFDPARNALAKEHGFRWDADARVWTRTMAIADSHELPFEVDLVAA